MVPCAETGARLASRLLYCIQWESTQSGISFDPPNSRRLIGNSKSRRAPMSRGHLQSPPHKESFVRIFNSTLKPLYNNFR